MIFNCCIHYCLHYCLHFLTISINIIYFYVFKIVIKKNCFRDTLNLAIVYKSKNTINLL